MFLLASCEVISVGDQYKGRNKPPKVARQGGPTSRPRSVAMNAWARVLAGKLQLPGYPLLSSSLAV